MLTFGGRLEQLINALGLTPARFGELYGINRVSMHRMVQGETKPSLDTLEKICQANPKISADFLLRGEGFPLVLEKPKEIYEPNEAVKVIFELQAQINGFLVDKVKELTPPPHRYQDMVGVK